MCSLSRNSEAGRVTWEEPMLASPFLAVSTALNFGFLSRLVPPMRERAGFGLQSRLAQSAAWTGLVTVIGLSSLEEAKSSPDPRTVDAVEVRLQEVGFKTNWDLSTKTLISLASTGLPSTM